MENTKILPCPECPLHTYQDAQYGHRVRVMNRIKQAESSSNLYRCTVCLRTRTG